jgi:hypothetical protein
MPRLFPRAKNMAAVLFLNMDITRLSCALQNSLLGWTPKACVELFVACIVLLRKFVDFAYSGIHITYAYVLVRPTHVWIRNWIVPCVLDLPMALLKAAQSEQEDSRGCHY